MMKVDITTASGGISSGQAHYIVQRLEGQNVFHLAYGTSSAKKVTLSFWMKTDTRTGVMGVSLFHGGIRSHVKEISLTTSWQKFELTYIGDTGDTFANDNTNEYQIAFALSAGSNFQVTANQWADGFDLTTSNQVDFTDNTSNNIYLTGLQMEVGEQATPFEHRSFGEELALCQRYYHEQGNYPESPNSGYEGFCTTAAYSTSATRGVIHLPTKMRTTPTLSTSGSFQLLGGADYAVTAIGLADGGGNPAVAINISTSATIAATEAHELRSSNDQDARIQFDAEL